MIHVVGVKEFFSDFENKLDVKKMLEHIARELSDPLRVGRYSYIRAIKVRKTRTGSEENIPRATKFAG